jgi:hypothetical protein
MTPLEVELYRAAAADPELANGVLDVFSRTKRPLEALPPRQAVAMAWRAARRPGADRGAVLRTVGREARETAVLLAQRARVGAAAGAAAARRV